MAVIRKLNKDHIIEILQALPEALRRETDGGGPFHLHIGGGAALVLTGLRRETADIDVIITDAHDRVVDFKGAPAISEALGLYRASPAESANSALPYPWYEKPISPQKQAAPSDDIRETYFTRYGLDFGTPQADCAISLVKPDVVLIQKLNLIMDDYARTYRSAAKIEQDIVDAAHLCAVLRIASASQLQAAWDKSSGEFKLLRDAHTLRDGNLEAAWAQIAKIKPNIAANAQKTAKAPRLKPVKP